MISFWVKDKIKINVGKKKKGIINVQKLIINVFVKC